MKIISGLYKGRNLIGFDLDGTRPTMDRVKESLFAMIQDYIKDSIVLDLFSGSGNLGIEAISNGAKYAYLVDKNPKASNIINKNLNTIGINNCKVLNIDYIKALEYIKNQNIKIDIIFLDPPYKTEYIKNSLELIEKHDILMDEGLIICESDSLDKIIYNDKYILLKNKKYGDKYIMILRKKEQ